MHRLNARYVRRGLYKTRGPSFKDRAAHVTMTSTAAMALWTLAVVLTMLSANAATRTTSSDSTATSSDPRDVGETTDDRTVDRTIRSILNKPTVCNNNKSKGSPYSITDRRVPELIPVLGSQPVGDVSHKPGGRLPLLSARPAVTPTTLKRAATNFAAW